jgi:predicted aldo/keto reductase-like oxidoreductase
MIGVSSTMAFGASAVAGGAPAGAAGQGLGSSQTAAQPALPRRALGSTGVKVSMLGLGGSHLAEKIGEKESIEIVRRAIDGGINFLDNCWDYNDGKSEERMGKALADGYRQRVFLMTKIDGRTKAAAQAQLEQSLQRLKTDVIDLVQVHEVIRMTDPERCFAPGGTIEALSEAKKAGKLRFIGFTGHKDPAIHLAMLRAADVHKFRFDTVQMPLNVMDAHYHSFEQRVLPVLLKKRIGVLGMKSMGAGDILKSGVVQPGECLRYALSLPTSVVICGMDSKEVLDQNLALVRDFKPLTASERRALLARTQDAAKNGEHEPFKTSEKYDGTAKNPHWLEEARI